MDFSYSYSDTVSRKITDQKVVLTDIVVNPSATAMEFKIHNGPDANSPTLIHIKDATVDSRIITFSSYRLFDQGMYFEVVGNITDWSVGYQYV